MPRFIFMGLVLAVPSAAVDFTLNDDVCAGFYSLHRDDHDGKEDTTDELRLRVRPGIGAKFNEQWLAQVRFAGHAS